MIFQTNHLPVSDFHDFENKQDGLQDLQNAGIMASSEL
jgi:hypothetical protein